MNGSRAKRIRKAMKDMGIYRDDPKMQPYMKMAGKKYVEIQVPAKTILGKPVEGGKTKTEFMEVPFYQRINPYKQIFREVARRGGGKKKK